MPGSQMSRTTTSKTRRPRRSRQASPLSTASTLYPSSRSTPPSALRTPGSSSTIRIDGMSFTSGTVRRRSVRRSVRVGRPIELDRSTAEHEPERARDHDQHGSSIANRVPRGTLSLTSMLPPCSATIRRTIARPEPAAPLLGRVVRQEQLVALGRRNAGAVVRHDNPHQAVAGIVLRLDVDRRRDGRPLRSRCRRC